MARRTDVGIAVFCAAWAAAFLADDGAAVAFAPLLGLAVLPARRHLSRPGFRGDRVRWFPT